MKKNLGTTDRIIRVFAAVILMALFAGGIVPGVWGIVSIVFGVILLVTSLSGFCPLYLPLGLDTLKRKITSKP